MFGFTKLELSILKKLSTPEKIQDFLDSQPINWEKRGETYMVRNRFFLISKRTNTTTKPFNLKKFGTKWNF